MTATRHRSKGGKEKAPDILKTSRSEDERSYYPPWTPSAYTAFKAFVSARLCAAIWSNVSDCDEVFNYWEPMHYLMHGWGFQTWEYSPEYAIRSYAYLWLHILPLRLYSFVLQANRVFQFYFLRCVLAFACAMCEIYFYRAVCKNFGANTGRLTLLFMLFSTGMFISCSAFLPSSFAMYMTLTSMAAWFMGHHQVAVLAVAASAIVGWPFAAVLGIPLAFDLVIRKKKYIFFIKWSLISATICLIPLVWVDTKYYGKLTITPLNILWYNVFTGHGPNIYGVESWAFYFLNGFLNFNIAFPMALLSLPVLLFLNYMLKQCSKSIPGWLSLAPMYIWILIFFTRPHKEERFLFPIYPLFALGAAVTMDYLQKLFSYLRGAKRGQHYTEGTNWLALLCALVFMTLSVSRTLSLYHGYHAPLDVYLELNKVAANPKVHTLAPDKDVNVCVGKEWYRFPSSFFLPDERWHFRFVQSEFRGQLPKPYEKGPDATKIIPSEMNDMNQEEPSRYINITRCHYLVDLDLPEESELEPRYAKRHKDWKVVATAKFLHTPKSHRLLRVFYIPWVSEQYNTIVDYNILRTTRTRRPPK